MKLPRRTAPSIALALATGLVALPAAAADCPGDGTQLALNQCAADALAAAESALEERVFTLEARLSEMPERAELLHAAQEAFFAYREAECGFAASGVEGGSIYPLVAAECQSALTEARTEALGRYLDCEEGDTTCPVPPS